eukprot:Tamp_35148.p2 GENE.Tamp_35148~~Tamp_35148.p2  ORF type:complete len:144 (+),score=55.39 Tamp_35148:109-540(+)
MAGASSAFRMGDGVMDKWKVFRRKSCDFAALVLKIDSDNEQVVVDGDIALISPEDLQDELSDSAPRWILWLFKHARDDGRVQYPLLLVYFSPESCNAKAKMLYSSCTPFIAQTLEISKVHELQDLEDMTIERLQEMHASSVTR